MIMRLFIILTFMCQYHVYGANLAGVVVDSETNEPVFGVSIIYGGAIVAFSDDEGHFKLTLNNIKPQDTVLFRHISYHDKAVEVSLLRTNSVVRMENRFFSLAEVTVVPVSLKNIIKDIVAQFQKTAPAQPYWAKIHQSQMLTYRGKSVGYVEYTGHMLYMGRDVTNAFIENKWIPEHIRRIRENPIISFMIDDNNRIRYSERSIDHAWLDYRFFDVAHPLGKLHKKYSFKIDSSFIADEKKYLAISYQQKDNILIDWWSLSKSNGQLLIEQSSNKLVKLTGNTNREDSHVTQLTIKYETFNHRIVPYEINMSVIRNKNNNDEQLQDMLLLESCISFTEVADRRVKNYKLDYNSVMTELAIPEFPYEPEYWTQFPEKKDMDFEEGATLPIYSTFYNERMKYIQGFAEKNMPIIKNEISKLKWEKIFQYCSQEKQPTKKTCHE